MSIFEKSQGSLNAFERLLAKIPGFRGYLNKEWRRESDKLEREYIAKSFEYAKDPIRETVRAVANTGSFDALQAVSDIEPLEKLIDRVGNRIRFADYGYSGFFDVAKVNEQSLDQLYQFDLALAERAKRMEDACKALPGLAPDAAALKKEIGKIMALVTELDRDFDQRERIVTG